MYAIFIAVIFFVIEIIASFFGYCITARGADCSGTGIEIITFPAVIGGIYFIWGGFSVIGRALVVIAQSHELKSALGLSNRSKTISDYVTDRGFNTLFMPRYLFVVLSALILLFVVSDLTTLALTLGLIVLTTDLRFLKFVFIKLLKLDKTRLDTNNN